jgi:hypothetical protein
MKFRGGGDTRNHRDNVDTIPCEVTKSLHDNPRKYIPVEKRGVESVCVINKFLKVFIGNLEREGRAPQNFEEATKTFGPEVNDCVVLSRVYFVAKRGHQMPKRSRAG